MVSKDFRPTGTAARALAERHERLAVPLLLLDAPPLTLCPAVELVFDQVEVGSLLCSSHVGAVGQQPLQRRVTQVDVRAVKGVEHHIVGVAVHERLAVLAGLDVEVRMRMVHAPFLITPLAGLVGVLQQRSLLGKEELVRGGGGSKRRVAVHKGAARRYTWAWVGFARDAVMSEAAPLLQRQRHAARVQEGDELRFVCRRLADCAERVARATAEAAVREVLAVTEASQVAHNDGADAKIEGARVVDDNGLVGAA
eukprot:3158497-Pleurochrysis_carterae.AAC.1